MMEFFVSTIVSCLTFALFIFGHVQYRSEVSLASKI